MPIANFASINCPPLPEMDREVLSKDQQYLYDLFGAVRAGHVSTRMGNRILGAVHHARFLNLASSVLRYYVAVEHPSAKLLALAKYVMMVCFFSFYSCNFYIKLCLPRSMHQFSS